MFIIEVIPIKRGINLDSLQYFSKDNFPLGSLIYVPIRNKNIPAIVLSSRNALEYKSEIKSSEFELKKINKASCYNFLSQEFIKSILRLSDYFASSPAYVLFSLLPNDFLKDNGKNKLINLDKEKENSKENKSLNIKSEIETEKNIIQGEDEDRFSSYRALIRNSFAHKKSVYILVPTVEDAKYIKSSVQKGIEQYIITLHSALKKTEIDKYLDTIKNEDHPLTIIGTSQFLFLMEEKINLLIIEKSSSRAYISQKRPFIDARIFAEFLAEEKNIKLVIGDYINSIENIYREEQRILHKTDPFRWRTLTTAEIKVVDMSAKERKENPEEKSFILSSAVRKVIENGIENNEKIILLVSRKGLSPETICNDCQTLVTCDRCLSPVVLHKSSIKDKNFYLCHRCGKKKDALLTCVNCGGWNLRPIGIGSELVEEHIKELMPDVKLLRLDRDVCPTEKKAKEVVENFIKSSGSVLITNEMVFSYIHEKVENTAIVSLDSILSLPDFRVEEKLFRIISSLRAITSKKMLVQTRQAIMPIFEYAIKGNILEFYRSEIENRKIANCPPFFILIKITIKGDKEKIISDAQKINELIEPLSLEVFPSFTRSSDGKSVLHGILKIEGEKWPNKEIIEKLKNLSQVFPAIEIRVDPDTLI